MISRRDVLKACSVAALAPSFRSIAQTAPDYRLEIATVSLDLSPHHTCKTTAYNGQVPGPMLRFKENRSGIIEVTNRSDRPQVVHWHGLSTPSDVDGAVEEGTPLIAPGATARHAIGAIGIGNIAPIHGQQQQIFVVTDLYVSPAWEINIGVGIGGTGSTDHLLVKAILGRRFDWGRHSPVD